MQVGVRDEASSPAHLLRGPCLIEILAWPLRDQWTRTCPRRSDDNFFNSVAGLIDCPSIVSHMACGVCGTLDLDPMMSGAGSGEEDTCFVSVNIDF